MATTTWAGARWYATQRENDRDDFARELQSVSHLVTQELAQWRENRLGDARIILGDPGLADDVRAVVAGQAPDSRARLLQRFRSFRESRQYRSAQLISANGVVRVWEPESASEAEPELASPLQAALSSRQAQLTDFHIDGRTGQAHLGLIIPIDGNAIVLAIEPNDFVHPLIEWWPGQSVTAENQLLRLEGDSVLLLSDPRRDGRSAMRRRIPLTSRESLSVMAATGQRGRAEGTNDNGQPAIGVIAAVPGTPWLLVSHVEARELTASARRTLWPILSTVGLVIFGAATALVIGITHEQARFATREDQLIAEQKRVSTTLQDVLLSSPAVVYRMCHTGMELVPVDVSDNIERLTGFTRREVLAPGWWARVIVPEDLAGAAAQVARLRDEDVIAHEFRVRLKSGDVLWVHDQIRVVRRSANRVLEVSGSWSDVTERRRAEQRIHESERRYRALFEGSPMPLLLVAPDTSVIVDASHTVTEEDGWGRPLLDGMTLADLSAVPPDQVVTDLRLANATPSAQFGSRYRRANGTELDAEVYTSKIELDGRPLLLLTIVDVTERREAQRALEQSEHSLRESLEHQEALLKEVHHRVKNNLQVINSLMRLESGRSHSAEAQTTLTTMQRRIVSMALLHETLYRSGSFAQIDMGHYLGQLSQHVIRSMSPSHTRVNLRLDVTPVRLGLQQAVPCGLLLNELLSNCLKHAFPEVPVGTVTVTLASTAGGTVTLGVTDDGVGLPADWHRRRTASLGLQLVEDLTRQLQGTITAEPGPGAAFTLVFMPTQRGQAA